MGEGGTVGAACDSNIVSRYGVVGITGPDFPDAVREGVSSPGRSHTDSSSTRGVSARKCAESSVPTAAVRIASGRCSSRSKRTRSARSRSPAADIALTTRERADASGGLEGSRLLWTTILNLSDDETLVSADPAKKTKKSGPFSRQAFTSDAPATPTSGGGTPDPDPFFISTGGRACLFRLRATPRYTPCDSSRLFRGGIAGVSGPRDSVKNAKGFGRVSASARSGEAGP